MYIFVAIFRLFLQVVGTQTSALVFFQVPPLWNTTIAKDIINAFGTCTPARYNAGREKVLNHNAFRLFQSFVTIGLLLIILRAVNREQIYTLLVTSRWEYLVLSIVLLGLNHILNVFRWSCLLQESTVSYRTLLVYYGAGLFSSNFLPTGIGGDGVRALLLSRQIAPGRALLSVILDRGIGTLALSVLFIVAVYLGLPPGAATMGGWLVSFFDVGWDTYITLGLSFVGFLAWRLSPIFNNKDSKILAKLADRCSKVVWIRGHSWRGFIGGYSISVLSHIGIVAAHWAAMEALGIAVPISAAVWLVLVGALSFMVPISINGIGLQESVYVALLACYGVSTSVAFGMAILMRLLLIFFSLIGGVLSLRKETISAHK